MDLIENDIFRYDDINSLTNNDKKNIYIIFISIHGELIY